MNSVDKIRIRDCPRAPSCSVGCVMKLAINKAICFFQDQLLKYLKCAKSTKDTGFGFENLLEFYSLSGHLTIFPAENK